MSKVCPRSSWLWLKREALNAVSVPPVLLFLFPLISLITKIMTRLKRLSPLMEIFAGVQDIPLLKEQLSDQLNFLITIEANLWFLQVCSLPISLKYLVD